jgi:hypothetical protein
VGQLSERSGSSGLLDLPVSPPEVGGAGFGPLEQSTDLPSPPPTKYIISFKDGTTEFFFGYGMGVQEEFVVIYDPTGNPRYILGDVRRAEKIVPEPEVLPRRLTESLPLNRRAYPSQAASAPDGDSTNNF